MRIRLIFNQGQGQADNQADLPFQGLAAKRAPWGSFWCSLCLHAAAAWFVTSYLDFVTRHPSPIPDVRAARVLELNVNQIEEFRTILAPAPAPAEQPADSRDRRRGRVSFQARVSKPSVKQQADRAEVPKDTGPSSPPAAAAVAARELREFKMPPARVKQAAPQTLVQLDLPPTLDLHQSLRTPTLVVLAAMPRNLAPKPFVAPPERKRIMEVPSQVALEMRPPILDVRPGYAKTPELLSQFTPRLPAPLGAVAPVASNQDPVEVMPAASTVAGNAVAELTTIISLPDRPIPVASTIVLPPLNQVAARDTASGVAGPENSSLGKASGAKTGSGDSKPAAQNQAVGSAGGGSRGVGGDNLARNPAGGPGSSQLAGSAGNKSGPASGSANSGSLSVGSGAGTPGSGSRPGNGSSGNGVSNSASSSGGSSNGSSGTGTSQPARVNRPRDGQYDLAIVQSSGVIPGSSGLLKGRPVYSVYLPVGASNEWVLQYCLPPDEAAKPAQAVVIQIGAVTPVAAPYAFAILRPVIRFRAGARYAFIHGFVSTSGQFERLTQAGEPMIENLDAVLENLQQWEFRPASKDGQPAVVEILLCIPNIA